MSKVYGEYEQVNGSIVNDMRKRIDALESAMSDALDAIGKHPDNGHPMTASEVRFRKLLYKIDQ